MPLLRLLRLPPVALVGLVATVALGAWALLSIVNYAVIQSYSATNDLWVQGERIPSAVQSGDGRYDPQVLKAPAVLLALHLPADGPTKQPAERLLERIRPTYPGAHLVWKYDAFRPERERRAWYLELQEPLNKQVEIDQQVGARGGKIRCTQEHPGVDNLPETDVFWEDRGKAIHMLEVLEQPWGRDWGWFIDSVNWETVQRQCP